MINVNTQTGKDAENCAEDFLITQGLQTLARNVGCRYGEIDLVMEQGTTVVFVEVRLRTHISIQSGAGSVDYRKQQRLIRAATHLIQRTPALQERPIRFDVIAYNNLHRHRAPYWIQQAFDASI